ncbi:hypothetical protein GQ54DRAFT_50857, partial [Martensiomyces pterosporus]
LIHHSTAIIILHKHFYRTLHTHAYEVATFFIHEAQIHTMSHHHEGANGVANSSAIADMSSWAGEPSKWYNRAFERRGSKAQNDISNHIPGHIETENAAMSQPEGEAGYGGVYDLVRAYLETGRGSGGTDAEKASMRVIVQELLNSRDGMDVAAVAFLATLDPHVVSPRMQHELDAMIRERTGEWEMEPQHNGRRLDDAYRKFRSDTLAYKEGTERRAVSALDANRFARSWISAGMHNKRAHAFHWCIWDAGKLPHDAMSEVFLVHGVRCRLRFRKSFLLSNGEDWVGVWLHNIGRSNDVLNIKFALVVSNVAYPTVYHAEVIKSSGGIRPSQGVGIKLFALREELTKRSKGSTLPVIEDNQFRVSVIYY